MDQVQYQAMIEWRKLQGEIEQLQAAELVLRNRLIASGLFHALDKKSEGTQTIQLGKGWTLAATKVRYYNLTNTNKETELALGYVAYSDYAIACSLVNWKPTLVKGMFKKLPDEMKEYFRDALTITTGQASLELNPPTEAYLKEQREKDTWPDANLASTGVEDYE